MRRWPPKPRASPSCRSATAIWASTSRPTRTPRARWKRRSPASRRSRQKPAFMIHTGDITHLSKESEFDDAEKIISQAKLDVHYVPGEHDIIDPDIKLYKERYGRGTKGSGYYSLRRQRRAFHGPGQRRQSQGRRHGQPRRRAARMDRGRSQGPLGVDADRGVRAYPAVGGLSAMGLGHRGQRAARSATSSASARSPCSTATSIR